MSELNMAFSGAENVRSEKSKASAFIGSSASQPKYSRLNISTRFEGLSIPLSANSSSRSGGFVRGTPEFERFIESTEVPAHPIPKKLVPASCRTLAEPGILADDVSEALGVDRCLGQGCFKRLEHPRICGESCNTAHGLDQARLVQ
jgi:hypothetical protein